MVDVADYFGNVATAVESTDDAHRLAEDFERGVCVTTTTATTTADASSISSTESVLLDDPAITARVMGELIERKEPVAVDFEGIALSRTGKLCLAQVAPKDGPVYLVDVTAMGRDAFGPGRFGELLESEAVLKLIFDCRGDSDALYHQYDVRMRHLYDVQVVYCIKNDQDTNAGRRGRYLLGLRKALADCPGLDHEAREALDVIKAEGTKLFAPELGGSYAVWEQR